MTANEPSPPPSPADAWEILADAYAARIDEKPHNAFYERPATLSLLPDVVGRRVLDAGCGPGVYAEWLARRGAEVVAFDRSTRMVGLARARLGDRVEVRVASFEAPLEFAGDAEFDVVLCALALDCVEAWEPVLAEFFRVLRPGGVLVFCVIHPGADLWKRWGTDYFRCEIITEVWTGFGGRFVVPRWRRPIGEILAPLLGAGFTLQAFFEPVPIREFREADPEDYEELCRRPGFLCIRGRKKA